MCGIFGFVLKGKFGFPKEFIQYSEWSRLSYISKLNEDRGRQSGGYLSVDGSGDFTIQYCTGSISNEIGKFESNPFLMPKKPRMLLCHTRAATVSQSERHKTHQPVTNTALALAHNGSILNWKELDRSAVFDTQALLKSLGSGSEESILHGLELLDGQHACWLYRYSVHAVYLWRVMSPLYVLETGYGIWFSSVIPPGEKDLWQSLDEGVLYRCDFLEPRIQPVGAFLFKSIY